MANQFSKMYDVEVVGGDQRQRLAEMLRANALNAPQGQMVSGWYVPPSWSQNLAQLANTAVGVFGGRALDEERKAKTAEILRQLSEGAPVEQQQPVQNINRIESMGEGQTQQEPQNQLQRIMQGAKPQQGEMTPLVSKQPEQPKFRPLTEEEKIGKVMELAQYNPYAAQIWSSQDTARQARMTRAEEKQAEREFREQQMLRDQQFRREMAQYAIGNRPEKMVTLMDAEGNPYTTYQSQMQPGSVVYTPATAKQFKERTEKETAAKGISGTLDILEEQYRKLNEGMGMPSTQNRIGSNIGAKLSGTGVGQWLGQVGGTENQKARDIINQTIPLLLADIKKKTGMTASEMNSEKELQMWLRTATDPNSTFEATMAQTENLRKKYGIGKPTSSSW